MSYQYSRHDAIIHHVKFATWTYIVLLIFEGALRKWVLPGLATPLLVARDPVAAYIVVQAFRFRKLPFAPIFLVCIVLSVLAILLALLFGHGNIGVALYGARPFFLHLPAMLVMAVVLNRDDVIKIGKFLLIISLIMTPIIAIQFYSPQTAFINRSVGGVDGGGFAGALGYYRPPGTFSFTSGTSSFYSLLAPFVFYFWLKPTNVSAALKILSTLSLFLALPFSISRGLVFQVALTMVFLACASIARPKFLIKAFFAVVLIFIILMIASQISVLQTAIEAFTTRFSTATESEGGLNGVLIDRYFGGLFAAFSDTSNSPLFGVGIGLGTNVGAIMTTGAVQFLVAENEWQRLVGEMGIMLGFAAIGIRLGIAVFAAKGALKSVFRNDLLPWLLLSYALTSFPQANWAQPTSLGFSIIIMALVLVSLKASTPQQHRQNTSTRKEFGQH